MFFRKKNKGACAPSNEETPSNKTNGITHEDIQEIKEIVAKENMPYDYEGIEYPEARRKPYFDECGCRITDRPIEEIDETKTLLIDIKRFVLEHPKAARDHLKDIVARFCPYPSKTPDIYEEIKKWYDAEMAESYGLLYLIIIPEDHIHLKYTVFDKYDYYKNCNRKYKAEVMPDFDQPIHITLTGYDADLLEYIDYLETNFNIHRASKANGYTKEYSVSAVKEKASNQSSYFHIENLNKKYGYNPLFFNRDFGAWAASDVFMFSGRMMNSEFRLNAGVPEHTPVISEGYVVSACKGPLVFSDVSVITMEDTYEIMKLFMKEICEKSQRGWIPIPSDPTTEVTFEVDDTYGEMHYTLEVTEDNQSLRMLALFKNILSKSEDAFNLDEFEFFSSSMQNSRYTRIRSFNKRKIVRLIPEQSSDRTMVHLSTDQIAMAASGKKNMYAQILLHLPPEDSIAYRYVDKETISDYLKQFEQCYGKNMFYVNPAPEKLDELDAIREKLNLTDLYIRRFYVSQGTTEDTITGGMEVQLTNPHGESFIADIFIPYDNDASLYE